MSGQVRNVFTALAVDSTNDSDVHCVRNDGKMTKQPARDRNLEVKEPSKTRRSESHENDKVVKDKASDSSESETGLRRSNRSNKGIQREMFDPSHIPSPKRRINTVLQGRGNRDNSETSKDDDESTDSGTKSKNKNYVSKRSDKNEENAEESSEKSDSDSEETDGSYSDPKKLWCLCRKPHNGRFMISCDVCEEWFHGDCVGITVQCGKQMEKRGEDYVCPACIKNTAKKSKRSNSIASDIRPKSGVKLKGYAHSKEQKKAPSLEKRKNKDSGATNHLKHKTTQVEQSTKQRNCIVSTCPNKAQTDSVYCSNVCILRHAKESLGGIEKLTKQDVLEKTPQLQRQESKEERILRKINEASSRGKVAVMCLKTGKTFANASAPLKDELETFLKANPTFKKLKLSKSSREKIQQKDLQKPKIEHSLKTNTGHQQRLKPSKEHEPQEPLTSQSGDPDYKPQEKRFSNPYKQYTAINIRDQKAIKVKKHKIHREDSGDIKKAKHKSESERRHSTDKNTPMKLTVNKLDGRSISDDRSTSSKSQNVEVRKNVQKSLQGILQNRSNSSEDLKMHPDSINRLVSKVEESLHKLFSGVNAKYKNRYRSIMFNLKDEKNEGLWRKVILGEVTSSSLVKMTAEEMASKELAQWRKHELTQELEMIHELEVAKQSVRPITKITHKGEIVINEDFSDFTESHLYKSGEKFTPTIAPQRTRRTSMNQPDLFDDASPQSTDTTSEHQNHLFDLNCMICTGQIKEEDAPLEDFDGKAVKRSTSIILSNEAQTPVKKETDDEIIKKINAFSNKTDKLLGSGLAKLERLESEETAETPPESPVEETVVENNGEPTTEQETLLPLKRKPSWENFLWTGTISMPELSSFRSNAYGVSGSGHDLVNIIPHKLVLDGRIHPKVVWEYLTKVRTFPNKEVCVIEFRASSEEGRAGYVSMLKYFNTRKRFGVVSNQNTQVIKDIYLAPLLEGEDVPRYLLPFKGPGIPVDHPSMLLGIIVRCKAEVKRPSRDIESRIAKLTDTHRKHRITDISLTDSTTQILPKSNTTTLPQKILQESTREEMKNAEEEEYNPETADFGDILDDEIPAPAASPEDDEEAYDPEKLVFDDGLKQDEEDETPYDPEVEAERLEKTAVKALQDKQASLEKMKQELEKKKAELAKEEISLQQNMPVSKPTKTVSQTLVDPRVAARLNKNKATGEPENPLQKIFSVLKIERPGSV